MDVFKRYDFKRYNISLLVVVTILNSISVFLVKQVEPGSFKKQILGIILGLFIAGIVSLFDYHFISNFISSYT